MSEPLNISIPIIEPNTQGTDRISPEIGNRREFLNYIAQALMTIAARVNENSDNFQNYQLVVSNSGEVLLDIDEESPTYLQMTVNTDDTIDHVSDGSLGKIISIGTFKTATNTALANRYTKAEDEALIDDKIAAAALDIYHFVGYISPTAPTGEIKEGTYWFESDTVGAPVTDTFDVYVYSAGAWSESTTAYVASQWDLWSNANDNKGYYFFGSHWSIIDQEIDLTPYRTAADQDVIDAALIPRAIAEQLLTDSDVLQDQTTGALTLVRKSAATADGTATTLNVPLTLNNIAAEVVHDGNGVLQSITLTGTPESIKYDLTSQLDGATTTLTLPDWSDQNTPFCLFYGGLLLSEGNDYTVDRTTQTITTLTAEPLASTDAFTGATRQLTLISNMGGTL